MQIAITLPGALRLTFETHDIDACGRAFRAAAALPTPTDVGELQAYIDRMRAASAARSVACAA